MSDEKKGQTMTPNSASGKTAPVERLDRQLKYEGAILKIYVAQKIPGHAFRGRNT